MEAAVASHVKRAVRKMRSEGSVANGIQVFINTDRFKKTFHSHNSVSGKLPFPTNDLLTIATEANRHLQRIFREGYGYKKAGVLLLGLAPEGHQQLPLFADTIKQKRNGRIELKVKRQRLNEAIEDIVQRYGKHISTWVDLQSGHQLENRKGGNRIGINFPQITLQVGAIS